MFQILIVEDDKELSQLFQKVLEKNGYQVKSASDGAQALERSFIITSTRNAPASFTPARAFLVLFKNIGKGKQLYFSAFLCLK